MRLVFSRDRAAQCDLLLKSLKAYAHSENTRVIYRATGPRFERGYARLSDLHYPGVLFTREFEDFNSLLWRELRDCEDRTVTFFCDDDVVYQLLPGDPNTMLLEDKQVLTVSWRLGYGNTRMRVPKGFPTWEWMSLPRHDFGFPGSIDGHTFRTKDLLRMLDKQVMDNPTFLETVLARRVEALAEERPLMRSFEEQVLVGVPVNRVSYNSGVDFGERFPQSVEFLNERFLSGERIILNQDFRGVEGCHYEILYEWTK